MSGLRKVSGGIAKREREAWLDGCLLKSCDRPAAGVIESLSGPKGICAEHIPAAETRGYSVRTEALEGCEPTAEQLAARIKERRSKARESGNGRGMEATA